MVICTCDFEAVFVMFIYELGPLLSAGFIISAVTMQLINKKAFSTFRVASFVAKPKEARNKAFELFENLNKINQTYSVLRR